MRRTSPMPFSGLIFWLALLFSMLASLSLAGCKKHPYRQGEALYQFHCAGCHMEDGSGLGRLIPPLEKSRLALSDPGKLICLIRNGLPVNPNTGQQMLPNLALNDVEMTNLLNFLGSKYGSFLQTVQVQDVKMMMAGCQPQ